MVKDIPKFIQAAIDKAMKPVVEQVSKLCAKVKNLKDEVATLKTDMAKIKEEVAKDYDPNLNLSLDMLHSDDDAGNGKGTTQDATGSSKMNEHAIGAGDGYDEY